MFEEFTGLYLNLFTNEITEHKAVINTWDMILEEEESTKDLLYLGDKNYLPSIELLKENASLYCSLLTKEEIPSWLMCSSIAFRYKEENEQFAHNFAYVVMMCCFDEKGELDYDPKYITSNELKSFKQLWNNLNIPYKIE